MTHLQVKAPDQWLLWNQTAARMSLSHVYRPQEPINDLETIRRSTENRLGFFWVQVQIRNQFIHTLSETTLSPMVTALKLSFSVISDQTSDTYMDVYVFVTMFGSEVTDSDWFLQLFSDRPNRRRWGWTSESWSTFLDKTAVIWSMRGWHYRLHSKSMLSSDCFIKSIKSIPTSELADFIAAKIKGWQIRHQTKRKKNCLLFRLSTLPDPGQTWQTGNWMFMNVIEENCTRDSSHNQWDKRVSDMWQGGNSTQDYNPCRWQRQLLIVMWHVQSCDLWNRTCSFMALCLFVCPPHSEPPVTPH